MEVRSESLRGGQRTGQGPLVLTAAVARRLDAIHLNHLHAGQNSTPGVALCGEAAGEAREDLLRDRRRDAFPAIRIGVAGRPVLEPEPDRV